MAHILHHPTPSPHPRCVLAIGNFDGVHAGHRYLLQQAQQVAEQHGLPLVVLTFEPHPRAVLTPAKAPKRLTTLDEKVRLLQACGVQMVAVAEFTQDFSNLTPEAFIEQILVDWLRAAYVFVGAGFRYGHKAAGDVALLTKKGVELAPQGFQVHAIVPLADAQGEVYSSTRLRAGR